MVKILTIIGIILLFALLLFVLLLCLPVAGSVHIRNDGVWIRLQVGLLHKTIKPTTGRKKRKSVRQSKDRNVSLQEKPDKPHTKDLDWGDLLYEVLSFLEDAKDRLYIDVLHVDLMLATGDAAKTGVYLGGLSALGGMIYPFLEKNFRIRDFAVRIDGDFEGNETQYDLRLDCSFRPIRMIGVTLRHGYRFYHIVK